MKHYILGDIHGCYYTLIELVNQLPLEEDDKLIFLGDYIDRGPFSKQVVEYVKSLTDSNKAIALMGNHEKLCLDVHDRRTWLYNGGDTTLQSYDTRSKEEQICPLLIDEEKRDEWLKYQPRVLQEHLDWMSSLPLFYEDEKYFYVHAGVDPEYPFNKQTEYDLLWIRCPFLNYEGDFEKTVVFGHTPLTEPIIKPNKIGIDTSCVFGNELTSFCAETFEFYKQPFDERDENEYSKQRK